MHISEYWVRKGYTALFCSVIAMSIIELGLSAWVTSRFNMYHNFLNITERDRIRYILFASIMTIATSAFYLLNFLRAAVGSILSSVGTHTITLGVTWIVWLAAAISITLSIGARQSCKTNTGIVYCHQVTSIQALAWVLWAFHTFLLGIVIIRNASSKQYDDDAPLPKKNIHTDVEANELKAESAEKEQEVIDGEAGGSHPPPIPDASDDTLTK